ncbi:MAG: dermonecrotic toxin domain-containing protein [Pseudomonas sp.]|uniref:dermonecrotic toxin domain-containing protein n=1 Tax=Pseudomonas sp. TaxID=306 RepID=UPI003D6E65FC
MAIDLKHLERSLNSLADARAVMTRARAYVQAWPDLYQLARKTAADYLLKHTGKPLDPDRVWWNVFENAVSAPTFTGWRHSEAPRQSMTFTQLFIHRFNDGFQLAPDVLPVYGGFYTRGSGGREYGLHNEIHLDAGKVMGDLWTLDFASLLSQRTERFWREHGEDFMLLAKLRFVALIDEAVRQDALTQTDRQRLRGWLGLGSREVTLAALKAATTREAFHIRHYLATGGGHLITLRAEDGRTVLYCPGTDWLPRAFDNHGDLVHWLSCQLRTPQGFDALYRANQQSSVAHQQAMKSLLSRIGPPEAPAWPFGVGRRVTGELFNEMRDWAKRDLAVSHTLAVSNAELRKTLWRGYLGAFLGVFGGLGVLAWPLGLVVLGVGAARLSLDIDAAVRARSVGERAQAILSTVADTVAAVFSIIDLGLGVKALRFQAPPHERLMAPQALAPTERLTEELESLDGNRILPEPVNTPGLLNGVSVDDDGSTWIEMNDLTLRVRHSPEADGWLAVDDSDPFAFLPTTRLRVVTDTIWTPMEVAQPAQTASLQLESIASGFWDTYMQTNYELHWELSQVLLERQRETLSTAGFPSPSSTNPLLENPRQFRYLLEDGRTWFTWVEDDYFNNDLIATYTDERTQANNLFRYGVEVDNGVEAYLNDLFDSLEQLPRSEAVRLWRGGSGGRATGGTQFRNGRLNPGDVLVTTDITSFTENPYALRDFVAPRQTKGLDRVNVFDDTSVVYELIGKGLTSGVPIGPMSLTSTEAEVVLTPGRFLRIESVREIRGANYHFVRVRLREVDKPDAGTVYDLRTGEPFDRAAYASRVRHESLIERFFPAAL